MANPKINGIVENLFNSDPDIIPNPSGLGNGQIAVNNSVTKPRIFIKKSDGSLATFEDSVTIQGKIDAGSTALTDHIADKNNPHGVTAAQTGAYWSGNSNKSDVNWTANLLTANKVYAINNVGVNIANPTEALHVVGNGLFTGTGKFGGDIQSGGNILAKTDVVAYSSQTDVRIDPQTGASYLYELEDVAISEPKLNDFLVYNADKTNPRWVNKSASILKLATLDVNSKIPLSQLPDSIIGGMVYQGTWNAATNTPNLTTVPAKGQYYIVSTEGTQFNKTWHVGDWIVSHGDVWDKIDNTDQVNSVAGKTGVVVLDKNDVGLGNVLNKEQLGKDETAADSSKLGGIAAANYYHSGNCNNDKTYWRCAELWTNRITDYGRGLNILVDEYEQLQYNNKILLEGDGITISTGSKYTGDNSPTSSIRLTDDNLILMNGNPEINCDMLWVGGHSYFSDNVDVEGSMSVGGMFSVGEDMAVGGEVSAMFGNFTELYCAKALSCDDIIYSKGADVSGKIRANNGSNFYIDANANNVILASIKPINFEVNSVIRGTVLDNGNWGFGTTTPTERIDVSGNIKASGYLTVPLIKNDGIGGTLELKSATSTLVLSDDGIPQLITNSTQDGTFEVQGHQLVCKNLDVLGDTSSVNINASGMIKAGGDVVAYSTQADVLMDQAASGASSLIDLSDVNISNPAIGQTIVWNPTTQKWENKEINWNNLSSKPTEFTPVAHDHTGGSFSVSDKRLKLNIRPIDDVQLYIKALEPVKYDWKPEAKSKYGVREDVGYGFIAQEVEKIIPNAVRKLEDGEHLGISYEKIIPFLVGSMQEMMAEIRELKEEIVKLKNK